MSANISQCQGPENRINQGMNQYIAIGMRQYGVIMGNRDTPQNNCVVASRGVRKTVYINAITNTYITNDLPAFSEFVQQEKYLQLALS